MGKAATGHTGYEGSDVVGPVRARNRKMASAHSSRNASNVGGFIDGEVFGALSAATTPVGKTPPFNDTEVINCYYREIALQRWLVYVWRDNLDERRATISLRMSRQE
jgi:hypothetical protein